MLVMTAEDYRKPTQNVISHPLNAIAITNVCPYIYSYNIYIHVHMYIPFRTWHTEDLLKPAPLGGVAKRNHRDAHKTKEEEEELELAFCGCPAFGNQLTHIVI